MTKQMWVGLAGGALWALATTGLGAARAAEEPPSKKEIQACYARLEKAFKAEDVKTLVSYLAPDYTSVTPEGTLNRQRQEETWAESFAQIISFTELVARPEKITPREGEVAVIAMLRATAKVADAQAKEHIFGLRQTSEHVWIQTPAGWKIRKSTLLSREVMIDGLPAD